MILFHNNPTVVETFSLATMGNLMLDSDFSSLMWSAVFSIPFPSEAISILPKRIISKNG